MDTTSLFCLEITMFKMKVKFGTPLSHFPVNLQPGLPLEMQQFMILKPGDEGDNEERWRIIFRRAAVCLQEGPNKKDSLSILMASTLRRSVLFLSDVCPQTTLVHRPYNYRS